jgi:hypothetical protein
MSGKNKVNPDHYKVAGRLSQDDLARERRTQSEPLFGATRGRKDKPLPPWMLNQQSASRAAESADPDTETRAVDDGQANESAKTGAEPTPRRRATTTRAAKRPAKPAATSAKAKPKTETKAKTKAPSQRKAAQSRKTGKPGVAAAKKRTRPAARKSARSAAKKTSRKSAKAPRAAAPSRTRATKSRAAKKQR